MRERIGWNPMEADTWVSAKQFAHNLGDFSFPILLSLPIFPLPAATS
jgi:hypothetical protein